MSRSRYCQPPRPLHSSGPVWPDDLFAASRGRRTPLRPRPAAVPGRSSSWKVRQLHAHPLCEEQKRDDDQADQYHPPDAIGRDQPVCHAPDPAVGEAPRAEALHRVSVRRISALSQPPGLRTEVNASAVGERFRLCFLFNWLSSAKEHRTMRWARLTCCSRRASFGAVLSSASVRPTSPGVKQLLAHNAVAASCMSSR